MYRLFPITIPSVIDDRTPLYVRSGGIGFSIIQGGLMLKKGASALFDTFFNCFSVAKIKQYAVLEEILARLEILGKGTIRIHKKYGFSSDADLVRRIAINSKDISLLGEIRDDIISEIDFDCKDKKSVDIPLDIDNVEPQSMIYLEVVASGEVIIYSGAYITTQAPQNDIKIGVVICTYKREQYVLRNLKLMQECIDENSELINKYEVFVIDNGKTLTKDALVPCANIYPNRNLGGSGGFTRGIMEVKKREEFTHFLLMDDDISIEKSALLKLYTVLAYSKDIDNMAVGGGMLKLDAPTIQYEMGSMWNGNKLLTLNKDIDLSNPDNVLLNELELKADYNAWWFMCMPISATDKGLPFPMFIRGDDIEYGLRWGKDILLLNGIGVWHESFEGKYSAEMAYYVKRNEMIVNALHRSNRGGVFHAKKLIKSVAAQIVFHRYSVADLIMQAYLDFLKGPQFFVNTDASKLHQHLRSLFPQLLNAQQIADIGYDVNREYYKEKKHAFLLHLITLNGYLIPSCFYNKKESKEGRLVKLIMPAPEDFYKAKRLVQYDKKTDRGMVTTISRKDAVRLGFKLIGVSLKTTIKYSRVRKQYNKELSHLTSEERWNKFLFD